jgi:hypothetical protein
MGELAIVREEEGSGRVCVEPAYRDETPTVGDQADHSRSSLRIICRGHDTRWLVQKNVCQWLGLDGLTVQLDSVLRINAR